MKLQNLFFNFETFFLRKTLRHIIEINLIFLKKKYCNLREETGTLNIMYIYQNVSTQLCYQVCYRVLAVVNFLNSHETKLTKVSGWEREY